MGLEGCTTRARARALFESHGSCPRGGAARAILLVRVGVRVGVRVRVGVGVGARVGIGVRARVRPTCRCC